MTHYKRYLTPLKGRYGSGKCLIEKTEVGGRITLNLQGVRTTPLTLYIFDSATFFCYPKPLRADKSGIITLRQPLTDFKPSLDDLRCVCLLDNDSQPVFTGYFGNSFDYSDILKKAENETTESVQTASQTSETADTEPQQRDDELYFKQQVKTLISELDEQLTPIKTSDKPPTVRGFDNIAWQKMTLKDLSVNKYLWKYAANPFVCNACHRYHHLLIGDTDKFAYLAVPCTEADKLKGGSQGLRIFALPNENENICYCIHKCEK